MDNYLVANCSECGVIFTTLDRITKTLSKYGRNRYLNNAFLTQKAFPTDKIKLLIRYRDIMEDLTWNPDFYIPYFTSEAIISRVKVLTNGL